MRVRWEEEREDDVSHLTVGREAKQSNHEHKQVIMPLLRVKFKHEV
jgi:hypothetical protein